MKLGTIPRAALAVAGTLAAAAAIAQTGGAQASTGLTLPTDVRFLDRDQNVRKATAIVNGDVITETDVEHRLVLILVANGGRVSPEEQQLLRQQVLRNLIDESLQIQAAESKDIKIEQKDIDAYYAHYAENFRQTPVQFSAYLRSIGSSDATIKRQIKGEIAWRRLTQSRIEPFVSVSEDEVNAIIARLNASRGAEEFKVSEIFLSATPENAATVRANAERIIEQIRGGGSFAAYARQFSEASTASVGGDLGWVRAEQLPDALAEAVHQIPVGTLSAPIAIPGGYSIIAIQDTRKVLVPDARDAVLSLKQISISFPPGTTRAQAEPAIQRFSQLRETLGGCGRAEEKAAEIGAEVVSRDDMKARDLPPQLQDVLLGLGVGQSTAPYGGVEEGVRFLVLCGRDDPQQANGPSYDQIYAQLAEERINLRAQRYMRDLRRDAVVDYR